MKDLFLDLIKTKTVRHSAITITGTLATGALGAVFYILLARFLGPSDFGIFSISVLVLTLLADVANVGINTGIVRFVGKYFQHDKNKALKYLKLGLKNKVFVSLIVAAFGSFILPFVAVHIFQKPEFIVPLKIGLIGFLGIMVFSFITSAIDATQRYLISNSLSVGTNALRLLILVALFTTGILTLNYSLLLYSITPILGFLAGLTFFPRFWTAKDENEVASEFFNYNKWIAIFTAIAALSSRLDSFILTRLLSLEKVGIYSVAVNLSSIIPQLVLALGVVAAPKLASFDSQGKAISYLKKLQIFVVGLAACGLFIGIPLSYFLIPYFYGPFYYDSIAPFIILLFAQLIFLISIPAHTGVIYYFSYPKLFVWISLIHLLLVGGLGWVLISGFGIMGAAVTVLIGNISNFLIPSFWIVNKFRKQTRPERLEGAEG